MCERGFSAMNREKTSLRNSLKDNKLEGILRICVNGEPLQKFDSGKSLDKWLSLARTCHNRGHKLTGHLGPHKKSSVNNEDDLEVQIIPLETEI